MAKLPGDSGDDEDGPDPRPTSTIFPADVSGFLLDDETVSSWVVVKEGSIADSVDVPAGPTTLKFPHEHGCDAEEHQRQPEPKQHAREQPPMAFPDRKRSPDSSPVSRQVLLLCAAVRQCPILPRLEAVRAQDNSASPTSSRDRAASGTSRFLRASGLNHPQLPRPARRTLWPRDADLGVALVRGVLI